MIKLNRRVASVEASKTLALNNKANALKAAGQKVFAFAAGEPDFDTPDHVKVAAIKALAEGQTKYAPTAGLPALRQAISEKFKKENGLTYDPAQIIVSNGAKHSLYNIFLAICDDGDEVILPAPYWLSYPEMIKMAGGETVVVPTTLADGYKMSAAAFKAAITPRTKAVIINSPSNPTGMVYSRAELAAIAEVAVAHNVLLVSDEIYEDMVYDGMEQVSIGSLSPAAQALTITVNGFSKAYSMTGWRLGYCGAPREVAVAMDNLQSHATSGANTFAQYGALAALKGPGVGTWDILPAFTQRRAVMHELLSAMPGVKCAKPMGAFYMFPDISALGMPSSVFAEKLLEQAQVIVVPGDSFGADANVRLSYACGLDVIKEGLARMAGFVKSSAG